MTVPATIVECRRCQVRSAPRNLTKSLSFDHNAQPVFLDATVMEWGEDGSVLVQKATDQRCEIETPTRGLYAHELPRADAASADCTSHRELTTRQEHADDPRCRGQTLALVADGNELSTLVVLA